jgi:hypothetical protein
MFDFSIFEVCEILNCLKHLKLILRITESLKFEAFKIWKDEFEYSKQPH